MNRSVRCRHVGARPELFRFGAKDGGGAADDRHSHPELPISEHYPRRRHSQLGCETFHEGRAPIVVLSLIVPA